MRSEGLWLNPRRPEQLVLQDDPAFLPGLFPVLDFNLSSSSLSSGESSKRTSMLSALSGLSSVSSDPEARPPLGLVIPGTSGSSDHAGGAPYIASESLQSGHRSLLSLLDDEANLLPDVDFRFDDDGNMVDVVPEVVPEVADIAVNLRMRSDSLASGRVRQEHEDGRLARQRAVSI